MNKEDNKLLEINNLVTRYYTAEGSVKTVNVISYFLNNCYCGLKRKFKKLDRKEAIGDIKILKYN